jgi:hypothetical protein
MSSSTAKVVVNGFDVREEGTRGSSFCDFEQQESLLHDCAERDLVVYHLLRMVRDFYINSKAGGQAGAYRKQCKTRRRSALAAILSRSEEALSFRWSCRVLGFEPDIFRNRVLFDVQSISDLMREGVRLHQNRENKPTTMQAEAWLWEEAPARYQLSEKRGHYIVKMTCEDARRWTDSLKGSFLDFAIESFELTSGHTVLILKLK